MASSPPSPAVSALADIALSAVICTYDRYDLLPEAIDSLVTQQVPGGVIEIVVVDNSPEAVRAPHVAQRYAGLRNLAYVVEPTPGLANARNRGIEASRAPIVAFLDDDARAACGWARELLAAHAAYDGRAGIVGGPVVPRWPGEKPAWLDASLLGYLSLVDLGAERRELSAAEWLAGCNISFDKAALVAAGGFTTGLGRIGAGAVLLSNEEIEASDRIRAQGRLAIYTPHAVVEHVIAPERLTPAWFRRRAAWQAVSDVLRGNRAASELAATAEERLVAICRKPLGWDWASRRRGSKTIEQDLELVYNCVVVALCGGDEPSRRTPSLGLANRIRAAFRSVASVGRSRPFR
jgi:GT2 family glycosyltransferase